MKIIKFRGKSLYSNKIFYGGYYEDCSGAEFIVQPNGEMNRVESVAQFVGYDADGKEIYEGDICVDKYYCTYREKAGLMATFNNFISGDEDQHFSYYKLKGK